MTSKIKHAAIMTAVVLVGIYIARQLPMVGPLADTALKG